MQFEEMIENESVVICETINRYQRKKGRHTSFRGKVLIKDRINIFPKKPFNRATVTMRTLLLVLTALTLYFFATLDYQSVGILQGFAVTYENFKTIFLQPYSHRFTLGEALYNVVVTLGLAFLTTLIGGMVALLLGLLAAENLAPKQVTSMIKGF
ncbi:MAG TPA: hypothetical protein VFC84_04095, partial [Desulfosporosinus sp.]|nr:hypothetical protein [Desulfosporosinus sp.]